MLGPVLVTGPLPYGADDLFRGAGERNQHPQKEGKEMGRRRKTAEF